LTSTSLIPQHIYAIKPSEDGTVKRHILLQQGGGDQCNATTKYSVSYEIFCNKNITAQPTNNDMKVDTRDPCNPVIRFTHAAGCPVISANAWIDYINNHPWIAAIFLIAFGTIFNFWGRKWFPYVIAIIGGGTTFIAVMVICSAMGMLDYLEDKERGNVGLVVLSFILAIAAGAGVGAFLYKVLRIGVMVLGGIGGYFLGTLLYTTVFIWANSLALLISFQIILAIVGAYLGYRFRTNIMIIGTAGIGSYAFIRGISLFAGHYPSEVYMYQTLSRGEKPEFEPAFYGYLAGMVFYFLMGAYYQYRNRHHHSDHYEKVQ